MVVAVVAVVVAKGGNRYTGWEREDWRQENVVLSPEKQDWFDGRWREGLSMQEGWPLQRTDI